MEVPGEFWYSLNLSLNELSIREISVWKDHQMALTKNACILKKFSRQFIILSKNISKTCLCRHLPKENEVWACPDCTLDDIDAIQIQ